MGKAELVPRDRNSKGGDLYSSYLSRASSVSSHEIWAVWPLGHECGRWCILLRSSLKRPKPTVLVVPFINSCRGDKPPISVGAAYEPYGIAEFDLYPPCWGGGAGRWSSLLTQTPADDRTRLEN